MKSLLVSIIIPTYNRAHLINETLDSVLAQTYSNWECIVVDDGSTDTTKEVLKSYTNKDSRFIFIERDNTIPKGGNSCRNIGMKRANGTYLVFLDSDDILMDFCLKFRTNKIKDEYDFLVFQSKSLVQLHEDEVHVPNLLNKPESDDIRFINFDYPWNISATIIKKSFLVKQQILWDERLPIHQDLDFYLKILFKEPCYIKIDYFPDVAIRFDESSSGNLSRNNLLSSKVIKGKIQFTKNIFNYIKLSNNKLEDYKYVLYALLLRLGREILKTNNKFKLFELIIFLISQNFVLLAAFYLPDLIYLKFKNRRYILKFYPIFFKKRFNYLFIKNTTLAKIKLSEYLQLIKINS